MLQHRSLECVEAFLIFAVVARCAMLRIFQRPAVDQNFHYHSLLLLYIFTVIMLAIEITGHTMVVYAKSFVESFDYTKYNQI